jgi:agmatine deiminase
MYSKFYLPVFRLVEYRIIVKLHRLLLFLITILLIGCKTNPEPTSLYPQNKSKLVNYFMTSFKVKNDKPLVKKRRVLADWDAAQGILLTYPFEIPINVVQEVASNAKVFILYKDKMQKGMATETLKKSNINLANIILIKNKKGIQNVQNIGIYGFKDSLGAQYCQSKFSLSENTKNRFIHISLPITKQKMLKSKAIIDADHVLVDNIGTMYADIYLFDINREYKRLEALRKTLVVDLSIKELIYVPFLEGKKLSNVIRLIGENKILIRYTDLKNGDYLTWDLLNKDLNRFNSFDYKVLEKFRLKEAIVDNKQTSYISALIFNNTVFVPLYDAADADKYALKRWQELMPNYKIIGCSLNPSQRAWAEGDCLLNRVKVIF